MKLAGKTDVGRVRQDNQDDYRAGKLPGDAAWLLVCDGMGGARGGREASQGACNVIERCFQEQYASKCLPGEEETFLKKTLLSANRFVFQKAMQDEALAGMGTTAVCALVRSGRVYLCHAGDSRAYLFHEGEMRQITRDHSMVQQLVDSGKITREQAAQHPKKNLITRALGVSANIVPEYNRCEIEVGDILLLCSDGLTNMISDEEIALVLREVPFFEAPSILVDRALQAGGQDNITVLLMGVEITEVNHG